MFPRVELDQRPPNFWRYREALGLTAESPLVSLGEVMTPLLPIKFRTRHLTLKMEQFLPTGSYKDRGLAVCMTHMRAQGVKVVREDSSGNAGASTAAYSAMAAIQAEIYVPSHASTSKINQIRMYGARCHLVPGARANSTTEGQTAGEGRYVGHSWNPFFACGVKSVAFEIAEQTNWEPPDWVVTPVGGGGLVMGMLDGFDELLKAGYIRVAPRILGVQSAACAPIYEAWSRGEITVSKVTAEDTLAEGIALTEPCRGAQILDGLRKHNGIMNKVEEKDILRTWKEMASHGLFVEPTSAVGVCGAWQALQAGTIKEHESVVVIVTGHGLKTKDSVAELALKASH